MSEAETNEPDELEEPSVTDVPEPDQPSDDETSEEEAREAEQGAGETGEAPEGEPGEGEQEAAAPVLNAGDEEAVERAFKALGKEATRHSNRISEIMGEDAQLLLSCPRCVTSDPQRPPTPGFIWPHEIVPLLPEDKAAVKLSIGEGVEPEFMQADDASRCPKCNGWGKVLTGSRKQTEREGRCEDCKGRGWIGPREHRMTAAPSNDVAEFVSVGAGANEPAPDADPWGRLRGDPLFGVMPGFEQD